MGHDPLYFVLVLTLVCFLLIRLMRRQALAERLVPAPILDLEAPCGETTPIQAALWSEPVPVQASQPLPALPLPQLLTTESEPVQARQQEAVDWAA